MAATPVPAGRTDTPRREFGTAASRLVTETKHAENNVDAFRADKVWLYITILTVGYMIARGLAKSGSREPYWSDSGQNRGRDDDR
jgi:hypothetical protein